jgi:hypothetical protein
MMNVVYKYPLALDRCSTFELPSGARVLTVRQQGSKFMMWAQVLTGSSIVQRVTVVIAMTGENLETLLASDPKTAYMTVNDMTYLTTLEDEEIGLIYHVYYNQSQPYIPIGK